MYRGGLRRNSADSEKKGYKRSGEKEARRNGGGGGSAQRTEKEKVFDEE